MSEKQIVDRSVVKIRELVKEAYEIASLIRQSGPNDVRFEASALCAGIGDVNALLVDLTDALSTIKE